MPHADGVVATVPELLAKTRGASGVALRAGERSWTRQELDTHVDRLAGRLARAGVRPGVLVGVAMQPSAEQLFAALATMRAGGAFLLLDPALPVARLRELIDETRVACLIGDDAGRAVLGEPVGDPWEPPLVTDAPEPELLDVAAVFCTSGSTGRPKAVPLRHSSIVNFVIATIERVELGPDDTMLGLANPSFDAWLLELVLPLAAGAPLELCTGDERLDGLARARALDGIRVFLDTPTRLRNLLAAGWWPLRRIKVLAAGEPLTRDLVEALLERGCRVYNVYGPAEVCVCSNVGEILSPWGAIPVGPALRGVTVRVDGGEIVIGGAGVARGYLRRPELSAGRFVDGEYRTGDVGELVDGLLYCHGRLDRQVKVRGQRIEPEEVEARIRPLPGVQQCAVFLDEGRLAAAVVGPADLDGVAALLRETLPPAMVPARWIRVDALPWTATGKVDVEALRRPRPVPAAVGGDLVDQLCALYDELIGRSGTTPDDDLFAVGGHSMVAAKLLLEIQRRFDRPVRIADIFTLRTPARLAAHLDRPAAPLAPLPRLDRSGPLPQSFEQARVWTHTRLDPEDPVYELRFEIDLDGPFDPAALRDALDALVARHEALRTTLSFDGGPVQRVHPPYRVEWGDGPLDVERLPGLRARLDGSCLELRVHHAFFDAWSANVLLYDLADALEGRLGPPPEHGPADVAAWQRALWTDEACAPAIERWRRKLDGFVAGVPKAGGSAALVHELRLSPRVVERVRARGRTVHTVLAAAWAGFLSTVLEGEGVLLATLAANRVRPELERMVGFFVNTTLLPIRWVEGDLVEQVHVRMREALVDAELPYDRLVAGLRPARTDLRPLARVFFGMAEPPRTRRAGALRLAMREVYGPWSPFDLALEMCDDGEGIHGRLLAPAAAHDPESFSRLARDLTDFLEDHAGQPWRGGYAATGFVRPERVPDSLPPLLRPDPSLPPLAIPGPPAERTGAPLQVPEGRVLDLLGRGLHLFVDGDGAVATRTGAEIRARAERIAGGLSARVRPGQVAALHLPDPEQFVVALWGCIRAGVVAAPGALVADLRIDPTTLPTIDGPPPPIPPPGVVLLLQTAGSTGAPKSVPRTDRELLAFCASYAAGLGLGPEDRFLNVLGLDHVAPLLMSHLITTWLGATEIQAAAATWLARPALWLDLATRYGATSAVAPSSVWRAVADAATTGDWRLDPLRTALDGGEAVVPEVSRRVIERLGRFGMRPDALRPGWGMSETCSCAVVADTVEVVGEHVALGGPLPGFALRIADEAGRTLGEGEVGRLLVRGPTVLTRYGDGTSAVDAEGWFDTGDLGRLGPGGLVLTGRAREVVVVHGVKVALRDVEAAVVDAEVVAYAAPRPGGEDELGVVVVGADPERAAAAIQARCGVRPRHVSRVDLDRAPRAAFGKLDRRALVAMAGSIGASADERLPIVATRTRWLPYPGQKGGPTIDVSAWTLADLDRLPAGDAVVTARGVVRVFPEDRPDPEVSALVGVARCRALAAGATLRVSDGAGHASLPIEAWRGGRCLRPVAWPVDLDRGARRPPPRPGWLLIGGRGGVGQALAAHLDRVVCVGRGDPWPEEPLGTVALLVPGPLEGPVDLAPVIERASRAAALAQAWGARLLSIGSVLGETGAPGMEAYVAADRATAAIIEGAGGLHLRTGAWRDTGLRRGYHGPDAMDPDVAARAVIAAIGRAVPPDTILAAPVVAPAPMVDPGPASVSEPAVLAVYAEVLGRTELDPTRGFFELGGTSLLLAGLQARVEERFGRRLSVVELFQHPTPRALARMLDGALVEAPSSDRAALQRAALQRAAARRRPT